MPLTLKKRGRFWYVRGTIRGESIFETTGAAERPQAEIYRAKREAELYERAIFGARAPVSFQRAALAYLEAEPRDSHTIAYVGRLVQYFEGKVLTETRTQEAADRACNALMKPSAKPSSKNRGVYMPIKAIHRHAAALDWCDPPMIKAKAVPRSATPFMTPKEALLLIERAEPHLKPLLRFLFCTGARLAEAIDLDWADVHLSDSVAVLRDTKNGRDRVARLPVAAVTALANLADHQGPVFLRDDGKPYWDRNRSQGGQIRTAWLTACRRAGLASPVLDPEGNHLINKRKRLRYSPNFTPHDTRHSWASWLYALTKDPMLVRDEGGWSSLDMVERYAHRLKAEMVPDISLLWGSSHPRIGRLPRPKRTTESVQNINVAR